jgi:hypothetical protein
MTLDFDALAGKGNGKEKPVIEPKKIFTTLVRDARFKFPSANQGEVLDKWFEQRNRPDNTIKMNTGSGKMLVGLLALQSSLNERIGPAVYIAADKYLVEQVLAEARDLGIKATDDPNSSSFQSGEAILVANVWRLFNGKSVFGVRQVRIPCGTVTIDDAHACLAVITDQFMLKLAASHPAYAELLALFEDDLRAQSEVGLIELKGQDPNALMVVPFWAWFDKREKALSVLHKYRDGKELEFSWPLLKHVLQFCQCVFGGRGLEIAPRCLPIDQIPSFARARRRIYMTATLADDGVLVTKLQANAEAVGDPIKPKGIGEIGDRMIIAPQEVNPDITEDDVKGIAVTVAQTHNVTVIVPSEKRAAYWRDVGGQELMSSNINAGIQRLKAGEHVGITVLVNRYDGIDLPDGACRLLIIDGLPESFGLIEQVEANVLEGTKTYLIRLIQKLEQGMGRGVRSAEDRCAVLLLGPRLTQRINQPDTRAMFTPATLVQMDLGREVTRQLKGKPAADLVSILDLCIAGDTNWWKAGRARLAQAAEGPPGKIEEAVIRQREAFDLVLSDQPKSASDAIQSAVRSEADLRVKGYLKQQLAEIVHPVDAGEAQKILLSAVGDNRRVVKPLKGITHVKLTAPAAQAAACAEFISRRCIDANQLVLFTNALAGDLVWDEEKTDVFEAAMRDLGFLAGFGSRRPDKEYRDGGPDNLWAVGSLKFLVIECKSGVKNDGRLITKDHCNQLLGAISWFMTNYDKTIEFVPILVHPVNKFQTEASPSPEMRILDDEKLGALRPAIRSFGAAVAATGNMRDEGRLSRILDHFGFTAAKFVPTHTKTFSVKSK